MKLSARDISAICSAYVRGESSYILGQRFGVDASAIRYQLRQCDVACRNFSEAATLRRPLPQTFRPRLSLDAEADICRRYSKGEPSTELGREFGIAPTNIRGILRRHAVPLRTSQMSRRHFTCNTDFWREIRTEPEAYWLGFIAADGSVSTTSRALSIGLQLRDTEHLQKFNRALISTYPVKQTGGRYPRCSLNISEPLLADNLAQYGVVPRKTWCLSWPTLPGWAIPHYVRGYFDGDGCIIFSVDSPQAAITIIGYHPFLIRLQRELIEQCDLRLTKLTPIGTGPASRLTYGGRRQVARIARWMYDGAATWLDRKYNRASLALAWH